LFLLLLIVKALQRNKLVRYHPSYVKLVDVFWMSLLKRVVHKNGQLVCSNRFEPLSVVEP